MNVFRPKLRNVALFLVVGAGVMAIEQWCSVIFGSGSATRAGSMTAAVFCVLYVWHMYKGSEQRVGSVRRRDLPQGTTAGGYGPVTRAVIFVLAFLLMVSAIVCSWNVICATENPLHILDAIICAVVGFLGLYVACKHKSSLQRV